MPGTPSGIGSSIAAKWSIQNCGNRPSAVRKFIVHGYKDCCGKIYIHTVLLDPPAVRVTVRDKGCGIVDVPQAMTPLYTTGEGERAGLGFTVMESFCDKLRVTSKPGRGTTVVLEKRITGKQKW